MVFHIAPAVLLGALLNKSQVLSHITRRVIDRFGRGSAEDQGTMVTVINQMPDYSGSASREFNLADWLVVPPPDRFVMLSGMTTRTCVIGVLLDGVIGDPPAILWEKVPLDTPVKVEFPTRALGAFFAEIDVAAATLNVRHVEEHRRENGHRVFVLRA
jgi:hypothetical protein